MACQSYAGLVRRLTGGGGALPALPPGVSGGDATSCSQSSSSGRGVKRAGGAEAELVLGGGSGLAPYAGTADVGDGKGFESYAGARVGIGAAAVAAAGAAPARGGGGCGLEAVAGRAGGWPYGLSAAAGGRARLLVGSEGRLCAAVLGGRGGGAPPGVGAGIGLVIGAAAVAAAAGGGAAAPSHTGHVAPCFKLPHSKQIAIE